MTTQNVGKFYQALVSSKYFNEDLQNKLQAIQNKSEYKVFISKEILPIAKTMGYNFNLDDILNYEQQKLQTLSEEELENITGGNGLTKGITTAFISILALTGGTMLLSSQKASAIGPYSPYSAAPTQSATHQINHTAAQPFSPYGNNTRQTDADHASNHIIQAIHASPNSQILEDIYQSAIQNNPNLTEQEQTDILLAYTQKQTEFKDRAHSTRFSASSHVATHQSMSPAQAAAAQSEFSPYSAHSSVRHSTPPTPSYNPYGTPNTQPSASITAPISMFSAQAAAAQSTTHSTTAPLSTSEQNFIDLVATKTNMSAPEQHLQQRYTKPAASDGNMFAAINQVSGGNDWGTRLSQPSLFEQTLDRAAAGPIADFGMQFTPLNTIQTTKAKCPQNKSGQSTRLEKLLGIDALILDTISQVHDGDIIQVASQSNGLESPSPERIAPVTMYQHDRTQGPRASCMSVIGAKVREAQQVHHCKLNAGQCKDVMRDWLNECRSLDGRKMLEKYPTLVQNGYFQPWIITNDADLGTLSEYLKTYSGNLQLITQLVNCERTGKNVLQVFNFAPSFQNRAYDAKYNSICESVVVAQYRALAQLAAIRSQQLGKNIGLHLTLVGQGAFNNPESVMRTALHAALNELHGYDVTIYLHGFNGTDMAKWDRALQ